MIRFACPVCYTEYTTDDRIAGLTAFCGRCGTRMLLPPRESGRPLSRGAPAVPVPEGIVWRGEEPPEPPPPDPEWDEPPPRRRKRSPAGNGGLLAAAIICFLLAVCAAFAAATSWQTMGILWDSLEGVRVRAAPGDYTAGARLEALLEQEREEFREYSTTAVLMLSFGTGLLVLYFRRRRHRLYPPPSFAS